MNRNLLAGLATGEALDDIATRALKIAGADSVGILVAESDQTLRVATSHGDRAETVRGSILPVAGTAAGDAIPVST